MYFAESLPSVRMRKTLPSVPFRVFVKVQKMGAFHSLMTGATFGGYFW
jgi:hypothetical protein